MCGRSWLRCFQNRPRSPLEKLSPTKQNRIWGRRAERRYVSATDDLIAREPFEPVGKTGGLFFCRVSLSRDLTRIQETGALLLFWQVLQPIGFDGLRQLL